MSISISTALAGSILIAVIGLVILRPKGLNEAWASGAGAILVIALRLISNTELLRILDRTWDAIVTVISLYIFAYALEQNGFFTWIGSKIARISRGSGWLLFVLTLFITLFTTAFLTNDGAVLTLIPVYAVLLPKIYPKQQVLPFLLAVILLSNASSGFLIPSNLTNIIIGRAFNLNFFTYILRMLLPITTVFLTTGIIFSLRYWGLFSSSFSLQNVQSDNIIKDHLAFWSGIALFVLLIAGYIIVGLLRQPFSFVAFPIAVMLSGLTIWRGLIRFGILIKTTPWKVIIFTLGMFVVVTAAFHQQFFSPLTTLLQNLGSSTGFLNLLLFGWIFAGFATVADNLPAALYGVLVFENTVVNHQHLYTLIVGITAGSLLTPFGAMATLLWFKELDQKDFHYSWWQYIKSVWWIAPLVVTAGILGLYIDTIF